MKLVTKYIHDLKFADYNPRSITDKQFKELKNSINKFGYVEPVIVNINPERYNIIVGGHMRVRVASTLGYVELACIEVNLNFKDEQELNIRLNKNTGSWDYDTLANLFEIDDLKDYGFAESELKLDNEYKEEPKETKKCTPEQYDTCPFKDE